MKMNKIVMTAMLLLRPPAPVKARRLQLSELTLVLKMMQEGHYSSFVTFKANEPVDETSIIVLLGSDKDKRDKGMVKVSPASFDCYDSQLSIPISLIDTGMKCITVYIEDMSGLIISNKLYYKHS